MIDDEQRLRAIGDAFVTDVIEDAVADGSDEVRLEGDVDRDRVAAPPQLDHDVLRQFFGDGVIPQHAGRNTDQARIVRAEDHVERFPAPGTQAVQLLLVGQTSRGLRQRDVGRVARMRRIAEITPDVGAPPPSRVSVA